MYDAEIVEGKAKGQRPIGSLFKAALAFHTHSHFEAFVEKAYGVDVTV